MKTCTKCNQSLPETEFHKDSRKRDGLRAHCRACESVLAAKYRARNPERVGQRLKEYRAKNREQVLARQRARYAQDPERVLQRQKAYRENNKERIRLRSKIYREKNLDQARLRCRVYRAKNLDRRLQAEKAYRLRNKERLQQVCKEYREKLADGYVRSLLIQGSTGLRQRDVPDSLVEAKRMQLLIKRATERNEHEDC